jgi:hypothetical protein
MAGEIESVEVDAVVLSSGEVVISPEAVHHLGPPPGAVVADTHILIWYPGASLCLESAT